MSTRRPPEMRWLPADVLSIDPRYQRDLRPEWVDYLVENFDPDLVGTIEVSARRDGNVILGGQHRWTAFQKAMGPQQQLPCMVHEGLSIEDEARIFLGLAKTLSQGAMDKFRARLVMKDDTAVAIEKIAAARGLKINIQPRPHNIRAIASVERVYKMGGGSLLENVLDVAWLAWGAQDETNNGDLLWGIALFLVKHGPRIDRARLVKKMEAESPNSIIGKARRRREVEKGSTQTNVSEVLRSLYNSGLRTGKLGEA